MIVSNYNSIVAVDAGSGAAVVVAVSVDVELLTDLQD